MSVFVSGRCRPDETGLVECFMSCGHSYWSRRLCSWRPFNCALACLRWLIAKHGCSPSCCAYDVCGNFTCSGPQLSLRLFLIDA